MAPEYIDDGVITIKSDIYSLGVIIRHMMMGRNSGDTTDKIQILESWMIRLEKDSSQMRQQTQLLEIGYKEQIKACIEMLHRCTRPKPNDRPTIEDILLTLEETEARVKLVAGPTSNTVQLELAKFGPWGGDGGKPRDIKMVPYILDNITISSGTIIDSIGFSYTDHYGQYHTIGPWGGKEGKNKARVARIGPSGGDGGVLQDIIDHNGQQHSAGPSGECGGSDHKPDVYAKFGPWGGDGGNPQDIKMLPYRLDTVKISSGVIIDSIEFTYTDHDGQYHTTGPWGGHGGDNNSFQLGPLEFLIGVSGTIGTFNSQVKVITSLTFVTNNAHSYGPFGKGRGTSFHIPMHGNGCIVGFFGRSGRYLNAIGVYANPEFKLIRKEEVEVARIGPWGGDGNVLHDITEKPHHLQRVTIFSGTIINSIEYLYSDDNGQQHTAGPWGGCGGNGRKIHLDPEEFIVKVSGTFHPCAWDKSIPNVVSSLTLVTNTGKTHGPFGKQIGADFHVPMGSNSRIVGFFAHGGNYIEAIGAYVRTL
ncbi:hypothetical protein BDA96_05G198500 [Sorghum bicolor]|uniref:Jacalin-type lectin domain-containing protein n=1 Tax=Sorghum bicolor TaxID=4558 RepID=A0A921QYA9_SORBI|nr:hypothetical protein BDA96_05G198500 [Sorghum bicolor]